MSTWFRWDGTELVLEVRVTPRASRNELVPTEHSLTARLTAPPVDNRANERLVRLLANTFGVPKRSIRIRRGERGRDKVIAIEKPTRVRSPLDAHIRLP